MQAVAFQKSGDSMALKCWVADSFFTRFKGLMGRKSLPKDEAIFFPNCNSIHTFFMRFPIDVLLVSKEGEIVKIFDSLLAWRITRPRMSVKHVIEMSAGRAKDLGLQEGDKVSVEGILN